MTVEELVEENINVPISSLKLRRTNIGQDDNCVEITVLDDNNNIYLMIIGVPSNYNNPKGCLIQKLSLNINIINTPIFFDAIKAFYNCVQYSMLMDGEYLTKRFDYIWAQKSNVENCLVSILLSLNEISDDGMYKTYYKIVN